MSTTTPSNTGTLYTGLTYSQGDEPTLDLAIAFPATISEAFSLKTDEGKSKRKAFKRAVQESLGAAPARSRYDISTVQRATNDALKSVYGDEVEWDVCKVALLSNESARDLWWDRVTREFLRG